ncbi:hypothetical protein ANACOL_04132 [Anaerotruncus colihominis DSM 17241]|uniref:Uncharacterized protein n=1 Tax=Anaerotruncus colihominis DSM 17241 TaxID=445972 RepID=B0PGH8_9FIRM|nr:hypothetical protein ANACOL_04132 [Anaerotruncus colihominis DSM 17241]
MATRISSPAGVDAASDDSAGAGADAVGEAGAEPAPEADEAEDEAPPQPARAPIANVAARIRDIAFFISDSSLKFCGCLHG